MSISDDIEDLRQRGSGIRASDRVAALYQQAFDEFGSRYLWSRRRGTWPTFPQALTIAETLRREGNIAARRLAIEIEQACRAAL